MTLFLSEFPFSPASKTKISFCTLTGINCGSFAAPDLPRLLSLETWAPLSQSVRCLHGRLVSLCT